MRILENIFTMVRKLYVVAYMYDKLVTFNIFCFCHCQFWHPYGQVGEPAFIIISSFFEMLWDVYSFFFSLALNFSNLKKTFHFGWTHIITSSRSPVSVIIHLSAMWPIRLCKICQWSFPASWTLWKPHHINSRMAFELVTSLKVTHTQTMDIWSFLIVCWLWCIGFEIFSFLWSFSKVM